VEPTRLDFGEIPTTRTSSATVKLINTSSKPVRLIRARGGNMVADVPGKPVLSPYETREVPILLHGGALPGSISGKRAWFFVEGQPEIEVEIRATAVSFVTQAPAILMPQLHASGEITLKSRDGQPFCIVDMQPLLVSELPAEPAVEHTLRIDWARYREIGIMRRALVYFDHPKCSSMMVRIEWPHEDLVREYDRLRSLATPTTQGAFE
jgi:hypothetical protein